MLLNTWELMVKYAPTKDHQRAMGEEYKVDMKMITLTLLGFELQGDGWESNFDLSFDSFSIEVEII